MSRWAPLLVAPLLIAASCSSGSGTGTGTGSGGTGARTTTKRDVRHDPNPNGNDPNPNPPANGPRVVLEPPGHDPVVVRVEIAATDPVRQRGLMYRESMDADAGMLFLFDQSEHLSFWMRNTLLPLDMIFITTQKRVLGVVENATPETDDSREVPGESQYVLEVNAGFARRHGISAGTLVRFEGVDGAAEPRGGHARR